MSESTLRRAILNEVESFNRAAHERSRRGGNTARDIDYAFFSGKTDMIGGKPCGAAVTLILGGTIARMSGDPVNYDALLSRSRSVQEFTEEGAKLKAYSLQVLPPHPEPLPGRSKDEIDPRGYTTVAGLFNVFADRRRALHEGNDGYLPRPGDLWIHRGIKWMGGHIEIIMNVTDLGNGRWKIATKDNGTLYGGKGLREHTVEQHPRRGWRIVNSNNPSVNGRHDERSVIDIGTFFANRNVRMSAITKEESATRSDWASLASMFDALAPNITLASFEPPQMPVLPSAQNPILMHRA